ncbi:alpha/beta fold hydrolase [Fodinicola acaciae]|uniref:alpha/beta fold hydrolase n=1 Tax=Fodinicola acaciae TaxID=2681555 RepID=UPI0013D6CF29|nr:alpha/beta fold hydrolase [Fodinicola acaciae]
MSKSEALGAVREVRLSGGTIRYRERGDGPPVVFVHGVLVNGDIWRNVVPVVADAGFRCITPDWPLGGHEVPVPEADLTPPGVAGMIGDFLERLDLRDVTLVANDTGGALTQIFVASQPERVSQVVLTPSDCFDRFFPPMFAYLSAIGRMPGAIWLLAQTIRVRALHRLPNVLGFAAKHGVPAEVVKSYAASLQRNRAIRADLGRFLRGVDKRHTLAAANKLAAFDRPVLLAWAEEDKLFPMELPRRLAAILPDATIETVGDSYTFVPEDQPRWLAERVVEFVRKHATT